MGRSDSDKLGDGDLPPAGIRRIGSGDEARKLAHRLLTPGRRWPVVVLTISAGHDEPFGDPEEIKEAVGDLAEVVLMPTSEVSWAFSGEMPALTQVYGGAGRVYPVDHGWVGMPSRSRLRFAYTSRDRPRITDQLINDTLAAAMAAGLVESRTRPGIQQRSGQVQGVIGSRALVTLADNSVATVWEELTVPGVPLDRLLTKGQSVVGTYDPVSRRLDLRDAVRFTDPVDAERAVNATYRIGDVVLADVAEVAEEAVRLRLLPELTIAVDRDAVTTNPMDLLTGLFTVGEIVACRVVALDPPRLRLDDVDDAESLKSAPSLLSDGPPWLCLPEPSPPPPAASSSSPMPVAPSSSSVGLASSVGPKGSPTVPRQPTPFDLDRRRTNGGQPVAPRLASGVRLEELQQLGAELAAERATRRALADELAGLRLRAAELEEDLAHANRSIEQLQTRYRNADRVRQQAAKQLKSLQGRAEPPRDRVDQLFLDSEEQFRYEIFCEWAQRIPAAEKAERPLAPYTLGPDFLASIDQAEGVSRVKVVAVVVEVLTEQVQRMVGRDLHRLRDGLAGSSYVSRPDGATCWRVALQRNAAAARRLHYWRTPHGYEFSRVVLHDDYRP
ncbi:hypothetical protein GCM10027280_50230 [Micromonospora polyrhachis]|uniref:S1 motif domain-containing protein n=1 Tax=Micromonospora polyrhachis TaxID=1282883 RepID=A0A7W7STM9_9ACTN|nr:hypothetical protein [Micromonospora polyrhachis]MBB4960772.1 hypothetical protein [Micromonospora polyrhachis]